jgi:DNA-3-methyladenine glycosylase I
MQDAGIIRMRGKITAIIYNAQQLLELQKTAGSFEAWLNKQGDLSVEEWIKLFKKTFKFTGKEITKEFLMGNGYLEGAHEKGCPIYEKTIAEHPNWYVKKS